eukprot:9056612-Lingulodinium_polyedra.AAC.1
MGTGGWACGGHRVEAHLQGVVEEAGQAADPCVPRGGPVDLEAFEEEGGKGDLATQVWSQKKSQ